MIIMPVRLRHLLQSSIELVLAEHSSWAVVGHSPKAHPLSPSYSYSRPSASPLSSSSPLLPYSAVSISLLSNFTQSTRHKRHTFSTYTSLRKKRDKSARTESAASPSRDRSTKSSSTDGETLTTSSDPFDLTDLKAEIEHETACLENNLQELRDGGGSGITPEVIEQLPVEVKMGISRQSEVEKTRIKELAMVIRTSGRMITILAHQKPVGSGLDASSLSQERAIRSLDLNFSQSPINRVLHTNVLII